MASNIKKKMKIVKLDKIKTVKFYAFGANGTTDPRHREGSGQKCAYCGHTFSFWDDLQISSTDRALKCATCKKIRIELIRK
jgi:hypothetical protein